MELKQLEYIVTIADERSLTKAAEKLFVSKSALSLQISRLEREEGLPPLFVRTRRGLALTDAGRIYVTGARTILNINQRAELQARELSEHRFKLRIGVAPVAETMFLTRVVPEFYSRFPNIRLEIRLCNADQAKEAIRLHGMDMALVIDSQPEYSLFRSRLLSRETVLWVSGDDFSMDPHVAPRIMPPAGTYWRATCDSLAAREGMEGEILCETSDHRSVCELLRRMPVTAPMLRSLFLSETGLRSHALNYTYPYYISVIGAIDRPEQQELTALEEIIASRFLKLQSQDPLKELDEARGES